MTRNDIENVISSLQKILAHHAEVTEHGGLMPLTLMYEARDALEKLVDNAERRILHQYENHLMGKGHD